MTPVSPNREQWWVIFAAYAAVLFVQRDNLRNPYIATAFVLAGAALLMWRFGSPAAPAATVGTPARVDARPSSLALVGGIAALAIGVLVIGNWPSSSDDAISSAPVYEPATAPSFDGSGQEPMPAMPDQPDLGSLTPEPTPEGTLSPLALVQEYITNNPAAEQRYRGQFIRVTGVVAGVRGTANEVPYIQFVVRPRSRDYMQAMFPRNSAPIRRFREGDRVTVSCTPEYDGDFEMVTLNDCSVVQ